MNKVYSKFRTRGEPKPVDDQAEFNATCGKKVAYSVEEHAKDAARLVSWQMNSRLVAYRCPFCKKWHIGHRKKKREKGEDHG